MWREDQGGVSRLQSPLLFLFPAFGWHGRTGSLPEDNTQEGELARLYSLMNAINHERTKSLAVGMDREPAAKPAETAPRPPATPAVTRTQTVDVRASKASDPAALLRPFLRGSGPCPLSGIEALIVYGACPVPGHLDEAAFNVYGWAFVAYQVGDVVDVGGSARNNQCVTKGDSISDLISPRRSVTTTVLATRSAAYSEALCTEATQLLEHVGEATGSLL